MCQCKAHYVEASNCINTVVLERAAGKSLLHWPSLASSGAFLGGWGRWVGGGQQGVERGGGRCSGGQGDPGSGVWLWPLACIQTPVPVPYGPNSGLTECLDLHLQNSRCRSRYIGAAVA